MKWNTGGEPSKRKPHNTDAGYIAEKIYQPSGSHIVIYEAKEQSIDVDGRYAVVCSAHAVVAGSTSMPKARASMKYPDFCEQCVGSADNHMLRVWRDERY